MRSMRLREGLVDMNPEEQEVVLEMREPKTVDIRAGDNIAHAIKMIIEERPARCTFNGCVLTVADEDLREALSSVLYELYTYKLAGGETLAAAVRRRR